MKTILVGILLGFGTLLLPTAKPEPKKVLEQYSTDGCVSVYVSPDAQPNEQNGGILHFSGQATVINVNGKIRAITCDHVIKNVRTLVIRNPKTGILGPTKVVLNDEGNDLALLELPDDYAIAPIPIGKAPKRGGEYWCNVSFPFPFLNNSDNTLYKMTFSHTEDAYDIYTSWCRKGFSGSGMLDTSGIIGVIARRSEDWNLTFVINLNTINKFLKEVK